MFQFIHLEGALNTLGKSPKTTFGSVSKEGIWSKFHAVVKKAIWSFFEFTRIAQVLPALKK